MSENAEERYTPDGAAPGLLALSVITALWALQVSDRKWLASPLLASCATRRVACPPEATPCGSWALLPRERRSRCLQDSR